MFLRRQPNRFEAMLLITGWLAFGFTLRACYAAEPVKSEAPKPAKLSISGYGLFGDRELKRILKTLELSGKTPEFFDPTFVEDAALILASRIKRDGFLQPTITLRLILADGTRMQVKSEGLIESPLPRPLQIKSVSFRIHEGPLYYLKALEFDGLEAIPKKQAQAFFMESDVLFPSKGARVYTPERVRQGISSLAETLDRQGYREAKVEVAQIQRDDDTGAVAIQIKVQQGSQFFVRSVREEFSRAGQSLPQETKTVFPNRYYSRLWLQDFTLSLKTNDFRHGYPDARVEVKILQSNPEGGRIYVDLLASVISGQRVQIGKVLFEGARKTKSRLLSRRVRVQRGELLDPIRVDEGRYRLARLGIFDSVDVDYRPEDENTRDVIYRLKERKNTNLSLLFGWGSYDLLYGGFEVEENNIWGLAHHARLKAVQSFKSSIGDFTYTIPELVGHGADLFLNGSGLRREEISFTRVEYGGGIGLHKYFQPAATDISGRYSYQILNATDFSTVQEVGSEGLTNPAVGSVLFEIKHDRRDNPLYPRTGYKIFLNLETASQYMGGDANYERIDIATSWHHPLGGGRTLSLRLNQGVDLSFGSPANNLPFNKRYFPGGQNSIRGYQEGEASPRNDLGQFVGAETYTLASVELEQALISKWSVVLFSDSLGFAHSIDHFPFDTGLFSIGGGLRWRTLVGPMRLEYGYNLNPRPRDPTGTLQFSIGFPF
jgi:outer membrane protein insertion porin family